MAPVLSSVTPERVLLGASIMMALTTYAMLQASSVGAAWTAVFLAGLSMAPVFPTALAVVSAQFPSSVATATGIASTAGWFGLVVSSPLIGGIAGEDPRRLKKALLVLPVFSILMVVVVFMS